MNYASVLEQEYQKVGKKVVYCDIGKDNIIVPMSYNGDINRFVDDIFNYETESKKYDKFNQKCTSEVEMVDSEMLPAGKIKFLPPFDLVKAGYPRKKIIKKSVSRALRKYRSTIKKTLKVQKEYPDAEIVCSMDDNYIKDLERKHSQYCAKKLLINLGKSIKFSAEQVAQITAGAIGITPVLAYQLLDRKLHFADNKVKNAIDRKVIPYICKGALKSLIPLTLVGGVKLSSGLTRDDKDRSDKIETVAPDTPDLKINFDKKYKISSETDFANLYNDALNFMALSMFPTEVLVNEAYSDNGRAVNTAGLGSYWYPKNGNPKSSEWITTSEYIKRHGRISIDGEQACALMDGWFKSREGGRVYKDMCKRLNGTSLTINEFVSIATVMYNSEKSGKEICDFVHDNYKDPKKCALKIMQLKPGNSKFNNGIKKRHAHEALIYLNVDDYVEKIPYFVVKKGINSEGNSYYVTSVTQLNTKECIVMEQDLENGSLKEAKNLANKICNYRCKGGEALYTIADRNGLGYLCGMETSTLNFAEISKLKLSEDEYKNALEHYNDKEYDKALAVFKKMIEQGFDGADIHNDMAITYFNMGQYEECIKECNKVLDTGEEAMYPAANYNAGKAYEKLGNYQRAYQNYKLAAKRLPEEKAYQNAVNRLKTSQTLQVANVGR